jgi:hypothetical protein
MPPAAAHRQSASPVNAVLVDEPAATTRLVVHPPRLLALGQEDQRRAVHALLELLIAALGRDDAAHPRLAEP